jgi:CRP/FNR family transcriptional regulator, cyclic AMP receptor protein
MMLDAPLAEKSAVLAHHAFFEGASGAVLNRLAMHAREVRYAAGQPIFRKGDEGVGLFAVLSGAVKISVPSPDGRELVLRLVSGNEIFGEVALLDGGPRTADATAAARCHLLFLDRRDFLAVVKEEPSLAIKLLALVSDRLRQTSEQVEELTFEAPAIRLAKALIRLGRLQGTADAEKPQIRITQKELGRTVGLSRETTNKCLNEWALDGVLKIEKGACTLLAPGFFSRLAGSD